MSLEGLLGGTKNLLQGGLGYKSQILAMRMCHEIRASPYYHVDSYYMHSQRHLFTTIWRTILVSYVRKMNARSLLSRQAKEIRVAYRQPRFRQQYERQPSCTWYAIRP